MSKAIKIVQQIQGTMDNLHSQVDSLGSALKAEDPKNFSKGYGYVYFLFGHFADQIETLRTVHVKQLLKELQNANST